MRGLKVVRWSFYGFPSVQNCTDNLSSLGAHPRESVMDQLRVTSENTRSLEEHGRQLTKTIGHMTSMIATAKGAGAATIAKMLPTSPNREGAAPMPAATSAGRPTASLSASGASFSSAGASGSGGGGGGGGASSSSSSSAGLEKRFSGLKTSLVEKYQTSKDKDTQL